MGMSKEIRIREIRRDDLKDIVEIIRASRYDFTYGFYYNVHRFDLDELWSHVSGVKDFPTLVAEYRGKVISYMKYRRHWSEKNNLYIDLIITHPNYRGLGAGRALITEGIKIAAEKGYDLVSLHTWASNRAMRLYSRLGFVWVPHTHVYMINLSPQLLKSNMIREFFGDPKNLVFFLVNPPQKIIVNGHVAWRYVWRRDEDALTVVFDMDSRRLLAIRLGEIDIELRPPEKRRYLDGAEIPLKVITRNEIPVCFESKSYLLTPGEHELRAKAKEKIELCISDLTFGFKLKTYRKLKIHTETKMIYGDIHECEVTLINNSDETVEGHITISPNNVKIFGAEAKQMSVYPNSVKHFMTRFRGAGKVQIRLGDEESELSLFDAIASVSTKEKIESYFWSISEGSIHAKLLDIYVYPELHIDGYEIQIEDKKIPWTYRDDDLELSVRFDVNSNLLRTVITVLAKKNIDRKLGIELWSYFPSLQDAWIALPLSEEKVVMERAVHNAFPRAWSLVRYRLWKPWYAMIRGDYVLRFSFPDNAEFTLLGPWGFKLDLPLKLESGEKTEYVLVFETTNRREFTHGTKTYRILDIRQLGEEHIVLRNNWVHELKVSIDGDIKYQGALEGNSEKKIPLRISGFGVLNLAVGVDGFYDNRKVPYMKPLCSVEERKSEELIAELADIGGSLKALIVNGKNLLYWSDEPIKTPFHIPIMHGGVTLELVVDDENLGLPLATWRKVGSGEYCYESNEIGVRRRYLLLDEKSILEEVTITNNANRYRNIELREIVLTSERAEKLGNSEIFVSGCDPHIVNDEKYMWLETKFGTLTLAFIPHRKAKTLLIAGNPIDFNSFMENRTFFKLKPKQTVRMKTIISMKKEKVAEFMDAITDRRTFES